jgi:hypothetical protein
VSVVAITPVNVSRLQSLALTLGGCGGAFLLTQLARDAGKQRESALFARWGGMPSVAILRHRDTRLDPITKARYHTKLSALVKGTKAPTPVAEADAPDAADQTYMAWSTWLRVNTRDTKKYDLLFQENVSYGYRRNLWGLRTLGILTSALCAIAVVASICLNYRRTGAVSSLKSFAAGGEIGFVMLWAFRITSDWVRIPANAYAERLLETLDRPTSKAAAAKKG